jgi:hypothetical protein
MCSPVTEDTFDSQMGILGFAIGGIYHGTVAQTKLCLEYLQGIRLVCLLYRSVLSLSDVRVLWFIHTAKS